MPNNCIASYRHVPLTAENTGPFVTWQYEGRSHQPITIPDCKPRLKLHGGPRTSKAIMRQQDLRTHWQGLTGLTRRFSVDRPAVSLIGLRSRQKAHSLAGWLSFAGKLITVLTRKLTVSLAHLWPSVTAMILAYREVWCAVT